MARRDPVTGTPLAFLSAAVRYCFPDDDPESIPDRDYPRSFEPGVLIPTGSLNSLLALPEMTNMTSNTRVIPTDVDVMYLLDSDHLNILVETQKIHPSLTPGFCYLRFDGFHTRFPYIKDLNGRYIHHDFVKFWQEFILLCFNMNAVKGIAHPEIGLRLEKQYNIESDLVFCISIPWPEEANEWTTRIRKYAWPSKELVHDCFTPGCHVVKKAHPLSTRPSIEWRFSFSTAEKKLGQSLTDSQRVCYKVFKALIKFENSGATEGIATYYLLTTLFWVCEEVPTLHWNTSNLGKMLLYLLDKLLLFVARRNLPNYFIPKANLIDSVTEEVMRRWLNGILSIRMNPVAKLIEFHSKFVVMQGTRLLSGNMVAGLGELLTKQEQSLKNTLHTFLKTIGLQYACDCRHDMVMSIFKMIWILGFQTEADLNVSEKMNIDKDSEVRILLKMYDMLSGEAAYDKICIMSHAFPKKSVVLATLLAEEASLIYQHSLSAKPSASEKQECLEETKEVFKMALAYPPFLVCIKVRYAQFLMTQDLHEEALDILIEIVRRGERWGQAYTDIYFSRFTAACMDDILRADLAKPGSDFVFYDAYALAYYLLLRCYTVLKRSFTAEEVPPATEFRERFATEHNAGFNSVFLHLEGCFCLSKGHMYHALRVFFKEVHFASWLWYRRVCYCVARLYVDLLPKVGHYLAQHSARYQALH